MDVSLLQHNSPSVSARIGVTIGALLAVLIAFTLVIGYGWARYQQTFSQPLRATDYSAPWIRASGPHSHAGYFRKRFDLPGEVKHAWIKIVAADAFEVSVNRNPLGRIYLWRPTRPFQNGASEKGQVLLPQEPALALNFPREYQWDGHDTWRLPTYVELTSSLRKGKNVITVETESRLAPARVCFVGEIQLWSGEVIPIRSDETWRGEAAIPGPQLFDWTEPNYQDQDWRHAVTTDGPANQGYRSHPEPIFTEPFAGNWIRHHAAPSRAAVTFSKRWRIERPIDEAWIRLITNRSYELFINGQRVRVASTKPPDLDNGDWVFGRGKSLDPTARPELLDPDEVGSTFVGDRFESPRKGHRNLESYREPFSPQLTPFRYIRTYNRAQAPGVWDPKRTLAESRRTPETPDLFPESLRPNSLKHDLSSGGYLSYSIANLLREGDNLIEVRCLDQANASWSTQIAVDGGAFTHCARRVDLVSDATWAANQVVPAGSGASDKHVASAVRVLGPVLATGQSMPRMQYRGIAASPNRFTHRLASSIRQVAGLSFTIVFGIVICAWLAGWFTNRNPTQNRASENSSLPTWMSSSQMLFAMLLTATTAVGAGLLIECAWVERHEILWFMDGSLWRIVFAVAAGSAMTVGLVDTIGRLGFSRLRSGAHGLTRRLRELPESKLWFHLCVWVLLLGALLRGYKLDVQPLDDDEYASTQAIMAIMDTGVPAFVPDDVYYTRSPLFHYVTAGIALLFGGDLWSLRLQMVAWSIATAWLTYLCGAKLIGSKWVGMAGMLLVCVHPFEIFTGHVIRFYQLQQFFALLTVYCFCRGFVSSQSQRYRVATLFAFLGAVLSQEISVAMGPSLILGYVLFAKDLGWRKNFTLILVSMVVIACIGLDYLVFKTLCLTRTEGVSPSVEAAVKPHFWYPMNLFSIFIGYSRLHIVPSFFFLASLPLFWREKNRNTLAMISFLISGVVLTNILVTNVSLRYLYWLFPIWILLSVEGLRLLLVTAIYLVYQPHRQLNRFTVTLGICGTLCFLSIVASWSPWRIPGSYEMKILGDSTGAVRWVRSQKRPGDRVAITEPHTHCAFIESGKCDYDLAFPLLYDFAVMRNGRLVDRNGGGEVVSNVDQMIHEFSQGQRIWILLNREKFRTRGKNMRWEYPGARFESFVRKNCELKHRTYLWSVFLWDPACGHYQPFRLQE